MDVRPRHQPDEVQTYFKLGARAYQLDHVFADAATEARVSSWSVVTDVSSKSCLSDHAPILITIE